MPVIQLQTPIKSNVSICFDLARSIDLHKLSTAKTNETAIAGVTSGLINLGESVTWEAVHFAIKQQLSSKITQFNRPYHFRDEQQKGAFKYFIHDHYFNESDGIVTMKDRFEFASPLGFIGKIVNQLILTKYMTQLLIERNQVIKEFAESEKWKAIIPKSQTNI